MDETILSIIAILASLSGLLLSVGQFVASSKARIKLKHELHVRRVRHEQLEAFLKDLSDAEDLGTDRMLAFIDTSDNPIAKSVRELPQVQRGQVRRVLCEPSNNARRSFLERIMPSPESAK